MHCIYTADRVSVARSMVSCMHSPACKDSEVPVPVSQYILRGDNDCAHSTGRELNYLQTVTCRKVHSKHRMTGNPKLRMFLAWVGVLFMKSRSFLRYEPYPVL